VAQNGHAIGVNLPAHLLPPAAKGVILRQVPLGLWIDHTIQNRKVLLEVSILVVIHALELWVMLVHLGEHVTLDEHEARRAVKHLGEPIQNLGILILEIHDERCGDPRKVLAGPSVLEVLIDAVPHHALLGITSHRHLVTRLDETHHRFRVKVNVGIDKQKVRRLRLLVESSDGQVPGAGHERLVLGRVEHHLDTIRCAGALETKHGLGIGLETDATVARGAYEKSNLSAHC